MGMTPRQQVWGTRIAVGLSLLAAVLFVAAGIASDDMVTVAGGVAVPVVVLFLAGPATRWMRRGEGPYATRSETDEGRETYVRLRQNGGNSTGR